MTNKLVLVTSRMLAEGWTVALLDPDSQGRIKTMQIPMKVIACTPDGNYIVEDAREQKQQVSR